jgi:hypothetical protein
MSPATSANTGNDLRGVARRVHITPFAEQVGEGSEQHRRCEQDVLRAAAEIEMAFGGGPGEQHGERSQREGEAHVKRASHAYPSDRSCK